MVFSSLYFWFSVMSTALETEMGGGIKAKHYREIKTSYLIINSDGWIIKKTLKCGWYTY